MFINELAPKKITEFIPDFLLEDSLPPEAFFSMENHLKGQMSFREYVGFVNGAYTMQEIVHHSFKTDRDKLDKDNRATWFSTDKVEDVRVFFRTSKKDSDLTIGSKVRLYSWGQPYGKSDKKEIAHLDSGFLTSGRGYAGGTMIHQKALASTILYHSLYAIGGGASVRKLNIPSGKDDVAPSYKMISAVKATYRPEMKNIDHILTPAGWSANVENPVEFFGKQNLDAIVRILATSKDVSEVEEGFLNLPEIELEKKDVQRILNRSNSSAANLSRSGDFEDAPGINVVATLDELASILEEFE